MYREFLVNIIEESFEALEGKADTTKALKLANKWAVELYDEHNKKIWFEMLKVRTIENWGGYPEGAVHTKVCPCGAMLKDKPDLKDGEYYSQEMWRDDHYPHDEEFAKSLKRDETRILRERSERKKKCI